MHDGSFGIIAAEYMAAMLPSYTLSVSQFCKSSNTIIKSHTADLDSPLAVSHKIGSDVQLMKTYLHAPSKSAKSLRDCKLT